MANQLLKENFEPYVGETFQILLDEGQVIEAMLAQIDSLGKRPTLANNAELGNLRTEAFSLTFQLPVSTALPQMLYNMAHKGVGEMAIFLVPVRMDGDGRYYEALFN